MRKNVSSQTIGAQLTTVTSGAFYQPSSGLVQTFLTRDAGTPELGAVSSGIASPRSYGWHAYNPAQSETNADHLAFTFVVSGAVPVSVQVYTGFPQTGDSFPGVGSLAMQIGSLDTRVGSAAAQVNSNFVSIGSLHTRVSSLSALIGTPVGASLAVDVGSMAVAVGSLHTRVASAATQVGSVFFRTDALPTDPADESLIIAATDAIMTRIGVPIGANLVTDVKSIQTIVNSIYDRIGASGINITSAAVSVTGIDSLHTRVSSVATQVDSIYGRIGPFGINLTSIAVVGGSGLDGTQVASAVWGSVSAAALTSNIGSLHTRVASGAVEVGSTAVSIGSLHARVSSLSALIGVPIGATLAIDVASIGVSVASLHTRVASISALIGAPAGASLSVDVRSIQSQVNSIFFRTDPLPTDPADESLIIAATDAIMSRIGVPIGTNLVADVSSVQVGVNSLAVNVGSLHTRVGSAATEVGSGSFAVASLHTRVSSLSALVGTPVGGTLATDVGSVQTGVRSLAALIAGGRMTADVSAVNSDVNAASNLRRGALGTVVGGTTGDSTTAVLSTSGLTPAAEVADQFLGRVLTFDRDTLTTNLRGQATVVSSMTAAGVLHVASLATAPLSGNTFAIT